MTVRKTPHFLKDHSRLPLDIQRLFAVQEQRFLADRFDLRLHFQKLVDVPGVYSFRVTRRYRVLLRFEGPDEAVFFARSVIGKTRTGSAWGRGGMTRS